MKPRRVHPDQLDIFAAAPASRPATLPLLDGERPEPRAGQQELLTARTTLLAPVAAALTDARWRAAAEACAALRDEKQLARVLAGFVSGPIELAALEGIATPSIVVAARRGALVESARSLEKQGRFLSAAGDWIAVGRESDARRVLAAAVEQGTASAHVMLARLDFAAGDADAARAHLRSACWNEPETVDGVEFGDDVFRALLDEARDLAPEPAAAWLPLVGFALNAWDFVACEARDETTAPARFHAALVRSRQATAEQRTDVAARRELKKLAPGLFVKLMHAGKV